ncbi:hypothetical protein [Caldimonas brevitalea]|uniref:hypothetical protein n=1 Tax=Caldimonas brevitalea TaxID=413882 RepID=UPI00069B2A93|nr:hypothetical protein [Caldimonas brevitalea]
MTPPPRAAVPQPQGRAWQAVASLLAVLALVGLALPPDTLAWTRETAGQPARWFTPVAVHLSVLHLLANAAGLLLLALLGRAVALPPAAAVAWLSAWPLTHLSLVLAPGLMRYGGLSGVLHAGAAVAAVFMLAMPVRRQRLLGAALAAGLTFKLHSENFWVAPLQEHPGWGFPVAVISHATGAVAGSGAALVALGWRRLRRFPATSG